MELNKLFYQPMWVEELNEIDDRQLNEIEKFCLDQASNSIGRKFTNNGGWQSDEYLHKDLKDTPLNSLLNIILEKLNGCMRDLGSHIPLEFETIWINVNNQSHSNSIHTHSGALSGSFYVKVPDQSASIFFTREQDLHQWFYGVIGSQHNTEASSPRVYIGPMEKLLVTFPSWMPHGVNPNPSSDNRISIAFNTQLKSNIN
jgi:uncharacterized protein (TIGR02466 family)